MAATATRPQVSPTGLCLWDIPDSNGLQIMWAGPGARLQLGRPTLPMPQGWVVTIEHPTARETYDTRKDAQAAVEAFLAVNFVDEAHDS